MDHGATQEQPTAQQRFTILGRGVDTATGSAECLVALTALTQATDALRPQMVAAGRAWGMTWDAIGTALGVSRQAARQRFGQAETHKDRRATPDRAAPAASTVSAEPEPGRRWTLEIVASLGLHLGLTRHRRPAPARPPARDLAPAPATPPLGGPAEARAAARTSLRRQG
jgi:hypothetical protein